MGGIMRKPALDLSGQRFGKWLVVAKSDKRSKHGEVFWTCQCDCGNGGLVKAGNLRNGTSNSCGCLRYEITHNMTGVPTFKSWESMKQRCLNPNAPDYGNYGARGITVCERWANSFDNFYSDMGLRPKGTSLDRIDVDKGYSPENCRWSTSKAQNRNRRVTPKVAAFGKTLTTFEWEAQTGIDARVIRERIKAGWSPQDALTKPNRKRNK